MVQNCRKVFSADAHNYVIQKKQNAIESLVVSIRDVVVICEHWNVDSTTYKVSDLQLQS